MKKSSLTFILIFLLVISCQAQKTIEGGDPSDTLPENPDSGISIFPGNVYINSQIAFGDSKQTAINTFGQPDNITSDFWEIGQKEVTIYHYNNGATLFFTNKGLESFKLTSPNYYLQMGSFQLKIGSNINSIQDQFSKSYYFRKQGTTSIGLGTGDYRYILIEYNSNNIITKIAERTF